LINSTHQRVFETLQGLPPSRGGHEQGIPLILGSQPPNVHHHKHPDPEENEIKNII